MNEAKVLKIVLSSNTNDFNRDKEKEALKNELFYLRDTLATVRCNQYLRDQQRASEMEKLNEK